MGDGSTRHASRILVFEPGGRILLFFEEFPDLPGLGRWLTPGGGAEPGERPEETALRELREETGIALTDIGPIVHEVAFEVARATARHSFAHWSFFVHRAAERFEPDRAMWTAEERIKVLDVRWWSLEELVASGAPYAPPELPELIARFRPHAAAAE